MTPSLLEPIPNLSTSVISANSESSLPLDSSFSEILNYSSSDESIKSTTIMPSIPGQSNSVLLSADTVVSASLSGDQSEKESTKSTESCDTEETNSVKPHSHQDSITATEKSSDIKLGSPSNVQNLISEEIPNTQSTESSLPCFNESKLQLLDSKPSRSITNVCSTNQQNVSRKRKASKTFKIPSHLPKVQRTIINSSAASTVAVKNDNIILPSRSPAPPIITTNVPVLLTPSTFTALCGQKNHLGHNVDSVTLSTTSPMEQTVSAKQSTIQQISLDNKNIAETPATFIGADHLVPVEESTVKNVVISLQNTKSKTSQNNPHTPSCKQVDSGNFTVLKDANVVSDLSTKDYSGGSKSLPALKTQIDKHSTNNGNLKAVPEPLPKVVKRVSAMNKTERLREMKNRLEQIKQQKSKVNPNINVSTDGLVAQIKAATMFKAQKVPVKTSFKTSAVKRKADSFYDEISYDTTILPGYTSQSEKTSYQKMLAARKKIETLKQKRSPKKSVTFNESNKEASKTAFSRNCKEKEKSKNSLSMSANKLEGKDLLKAGPLATLNNQPGDPSNDAAELLDDLCTSLNIPKKYNAMKNESITNQPHKLSGGILDFDLGDSGNNIASNSLTSGLSNGINHSSNSWDFGLNKVSAPPGLSTNFSNNNDLLDMPSLDFSSSVSIDFDDLLGM